MDGKNGSGNALLRYWTDERSAYEDGLIRIEWDSEGRTHSTMGRYWSDDNCVTWEYDEPTGKRLYNLAAECGAAGNELDVIGAEFMGTETRAQMERAVELRCQACGVVQASIDALSEDGQCSRCFVAGMAQDADLVIYPADYVSPETKREIERSTAERLAPGGSF